MSPRLLVSRLSKATRRRIGLSACILGNLLMLSGCAKDPPGTGTSAALSGKRLVVTIQFANPINPNYHYFFLMNYAKNTDGSPGGGDTEAKGPIAVLEPLTLGAGQSYGNGFATSINTTGGFTDFVKFENNTYGLYHVVGDPTLNRNFIYQGQPVAFTLPQGGNVLQFEIDLSQIVLNANGTTLSATQTVEIVKNTLKWVQVNIVATDVIPLASQATLVAKQVDALGDTRMAAGQTSFLNLDMTQTTTYNNQAFAGQNVFEPSSPDVFVTGGNPIDESLDILDYSIVVVQK